MERGLRVRVADRPVTLGEHSFSRGSVTVLPADNRSFDGDLGEAVSAVAEGLHLDVVAVSTGLGDEELPDLGGGHFRLLEAPRIALLARAGGTYDYGSIWYTLDHHLGIRHTQLETGRLGRADLRRYNVLVVPDGAVGELGDGEWQALKSWVQAGGTLIATARSAARIADEELGMSSVRRLRDVLGDLDAYQSAVLREEMARASALPAEGDVWSHLAVPAESNPWQGVGDLERADSETLESRDAWDRMFMPQGGDSGGPHRRRALAHLRRRRRAAGAGRGRLGADGQAPGRDAGAVGGPGRRRGRRSAQARLVGGGPRARSCACA